MTRNKWIILLIILVVSVGIGGKVYMTEKDKKQSLEIQQDLAKYLSKNYALYTINKEKENAIIKEFNRGEGSITEKEYFSKLANIRKYKNINKVEFTGYSITPMNTVKIHFVVNDVYKDETALDTVSFETNKPIYRISTNSGNGPVYMDKKKINSAVDVNIKFYDGKIR